MELNALPQEKMVEKVRRLCEQDNRVIAAVMYGAFTKNEGDEFSDIEFYLFFKEDAIDQLDFEAWLSQITPLEVFFVDEFGNSVAIFENLIRGEFHFEKASAMAQLSNWKQNVWVSDVKSMLILDRTGELARYLSDLIGPAPDRSSPENINSLCNNFLNWIVFGTNVLKRGERARALELLWFVHRNLLKMVRVVEGKIEHYPTPSKRLEQDISKASYKRFTKCTSSLEKAESLENAYIASWTWGRELMSEFSKSHKIELREMLINKIDHRLTQWFDSNFT